MTELEEKTMRKVLALILALVMVAALFAGCAGDEDKPAENDDGAKTYKIIYVTPSTASDFWSQVETGYTGKGMRIAILDTGILVTHPSFGALSEDKLEDPITRESVEEIWNTLNAGQRTSRL